jgi:VWFA-related protein
VKAAVYAAMLILLAHSALGQGTTSGRASKPTIRSTATLVIVPTLVWSDSGERVSNLDAGDFRLSDNGIEQKVSVEKAEDQPLAIVVLMQTGGAASGHFQNYSKLDSVLEHMLGSSTRKVALVTFDSRPEQIWNFPPRVDALYYFLTHPQGGDHGAAILDAVNCAIGLLQHQPTGFRRIILLLSQAQDAGSKDHAEDVLRALVESGTTIYSVTFSPLSDSVSQSDTISLSTSLGVVLKAMHEDTAAELAVLSGGEQIRFHDEPDLETQLSILTDDIHNGYTLSFYPSSHESGLHTITVHVIKDRNPLRVTSRMGYWFDGKTTE